jgi:hypothetical protein
MQIEVHQVNNTRIAEVVSQSTIITNAQDGLDLLGNLYYQDFDRIIVHEKNITPAFFDLKTGIAGEILQKFSNYRVRLAIVGDFSAYQSQSIKDFMFESNKLRQVNFVSTVPEAVRVLGG